MCERDFSRPRVQTAADQSRHAGGMVRRAERAPIGQRAAFDLAGDRGDHGNFEQFGRRQRRQDRGQPRREHRFAGAGRADHEQVVAAGRGDFERAFRAFLALDVGKVECGTVHFQYFRLRPRQHLGTLEMIGELNERRRGDDLDFRARPGRFRPACRRAHQAFTARIGADGGGQDGIDNIAQGWQEQFMNRVPRLPARGCEEFMAGGFEDFIGQRPIINCAGQD